MYLSVSDYHIELSTARYFCLLIGFSPLSRILNKWISMLVPVDMDVDLNQNDPICLRFFSSSVFAGIVSKFKLCQIVTKFYLICASKYTTFISFPDKSKTFKEKYNIYKHIVIYYYDNCC